MIRIRSVKPLARFQVQLELTDGRTKKVDLEPYSRGPVFDSLRKNRQMFETVRVDEALGTIVWENGADIDPDVLVENLLPAWAEKERRAVAGKAAVAHEPPVSYGSKKKKRSKKREDSDDRRAYCDPTYINADVGACMTQFKSVKPNVIRIE